MSYCRWSSDDYRCDLYVYESDEGFKVHVASLRYLFTEPMPEPVNIATDPNGWIDRQAVVHEAIDKAKYERIGLPSDGKIFTLATAEECAAKVEALIAEGYCCPAGVPDDIRSDAV